MEAIILKCPPSARFHFGTTAPDNDSALSGTSAYFHSDTLFSALMVICSKVFPRKVSVLRDYFENGNVRISSGNYCLDIKEGKELVNRLYFLPKPEHFNLQGRTHQERKDIKKIRFISKTIWEKGINAKEWGNYGCFSIAGQFLVHPEDFPIEKKEELTSIYKIKTEPKIADHARKKKGNIYFQTDLFLTTSKIDSWIIQPHFYFLIDFGGQDEIIQNLIHFLIDVLVDEGLGGAISTGCGKIQAIERIKDWQLDFENGKIAPTQKVSLALIALKKEENWGGLHLGDTIVRGGRTVYVDNEADPPEPIKCKRIKMIQEGALITENIKGTVATLFEENPFLILRYGKAFPLSIHENFSL